MTYKQRLIRGLLALGYTPTTGNSRKYEVYESKERNLRVWVGKSGALRTGRTATSSYSLGEPSNQTILYKSILKAGEAQASQPPTTPSHATSKASPIP